MSDNAAQIDDLLAPLVSFRRDIHANSERAYGEHRTAGEVKEALREPELGVRTGIGGTRVVAMPPCLRVCRPFCSHDAEAGHLDRELSTAGHFPRNSPEYTAILANVINIYYRVLQENGNPYRNLYHTLLTV